MKYTFKDQIARKEERRLGGEKRNQSLRDHETKSLRTKMHHIWDAKREKKR